MGRLEEKKEGSETKRKYLGEGGRKSIGGHVSPKKEKEKQIVLRERKKKKSDAYLTVVEKKRERGAFPVKENGPSCFYEEEKKINDSTCEKKALFTFVSTGEKRARTVLEKGEGIPTFHGWKRKKKRNTQNVNFKKKMGKKNATATS